jgi:MoaA/NifB/PqqE/SkfB family radical SAM enzyme
MNVIKWLKTKKYNYDLFLKPLSLCNRINVINRKVKTVLSHNSSPQSLEIGLSYRCQLNCIHCGVHGESDPTRKELAPSEMKDIIAQAQELGVYFVVFSGGEPLLNEHVVEFFSYTAQKGIITALSTNGQLLTKDIVKELKRERVAFINVSIDNAQPAVHDKLRGVKGCFQKAQEGIRRCVDEGVPIIVSTYATKENISNGDLRNIISMSKKIGARGVRILFVVPAGKLLGCSRIDFSDQEKKYVRSLLDPSYVYIEGVRNKFTECNTILKKLFYLSPYGDVQPCSFVPLSFGNIRKKPLADIWETMINHEFYKIIDGKDCIMRNKVFQKKYLGFLKGKNKKWPLPIDDCI